MKVNGVFAVPPLFLSRWLTGALTSGFNSVAHVSFPRQNHSYTLRFNDHLPQSRRSLLVSPVFHTNASLPAAAADPASAPGCRFISITLGGNRGDPTKGAE